MHSVGGRAVPSGVWIRHPAPATPYDVSNKEWVFLASYLTLIGKDATRGYLPRTDACRIEGAVLPR